MPDKNRWITPVLSDFLRTYCNPKINYRFFIGFSCGLPFLLTLTILDLWLKEYGISNTAIGLFTLLHWPFTLKFLWAPFIDRFNFPFLSKKIGRLRGWAVASQITLFLGLLGMACSSPDSSLCRLILFASLVAFADGCQDISLYAYQLDKARKNMLGPIAGVIIFGYKIGMFFAKSFSLYLAYYFGWNAAYGAMAVGILCCTPFICCISEPQINDSPDVEIESMVKSYESSNRSKSEFVRLLKKTIFECLVCPFKIFMERDDWKNLIALVVLFKAGYIITQKMAKPFYVDMGFSILEIANVVQVFGAVAALIGGMIGGYFVKKMGVIRAMFGTSIAHASSCLAYLALAQLGHCRDMLYVTVFIDNITEGSMGASFIAFLYSLCDCNRYKATQYALLWAFYDGGGMLCRIISGIAADMLGWTGFFLFVPLTFIPSLIILRNVMAKSGRKR
ncbi:MAG: MFS transporter [Holosporaceae bacterium]|jgi:PAT family beta-lactamase induction signal transducer AmpG|nr:MFS transporter [Holosporaceae bacterium]